MDHITQDTWTENAAKPSSVHDIVSEYTDTDAESDSHTESARR